MNASPQKSSIRAKTQQVVAHHRDDATPGKPLYLLIPGGLIALAALGLIIYLLYQVLAQGDSASLSQQQGFGLVALLAPVYITGVFLFSYGYELYNLRKALRLTAIVVVTTLASVIIIAVLFVLLGSSSSSSSSSSKSSSGDKEKSSGSSSTSAGERRGFLAGISSALGRSGSSSGTDVSVRSSGSSTWGGGGGPAIFDINLPTRTVEKEVIHETPVGPKPVLCPSCGRPYIPAEHHFACPNCGATTPETLAAESRGAEEA